MPGDTGQSVRPLIAMAWMLEVDGFLRDVRNLPLEIQIEACAKGLIPYVPALRDQARLNSIKREK